MEQQELTAAEIRDYRWSVTSIALSFVVLIGLAAVQLDWIDSFEYGPYVALFNVLAWAQAVAMALSCSKESPRTCRTTGAVGISLAFIIGLTFLLLSGGELSVFAVIFGWLFIPVFTVGCWFSKQKALAIFNVLVIYLLVWPGINFLTSQETTKQVDDLRITMSMDNGRCQIVASLPEGRDIREEYDFLSMSVEGKLSALISLPPIRVGGAVALDNLEHPANIVKVQGFLQPPDWAPGWSAYVHIPKIRRDIRKLLISDPSKKQFIPVKSQYHGKSMELRSYKVVPSFHGAPMSYLKINVIMKGYAKVSPLGREILFYDDHGKPIQHRIDKIEKHGNEYDLDIWVCPAPKPNQEVWIEPNRYADDDIYVAFRSMAR